jgi:phosphoglycerate dehydrogenase-like enzyme
VPNVVLTPHIASATLATRLAMANLAADNLIAWLTEGRALTPVNPEVLPLVQPAALSAAATSRPAAPLPPSHAG